jgi:hypothetical protein
MGLLLLPPELETPNNEAADNTGRAACGCGTGTAAVELPLAFGGTGGGVLGILPVGSQCELVAMYFV